MLPEAPDLAETTEPLTSDNIREAVLSTVRTADPALTASEFSLAVAVSGGADSLALILLAADAFPGRVQGLTVDHGLRPEAAAEAAHVAQWLSSRRIPHATLLWEGKKPKANLQAEARQARYRLLDEWCRANNVPVLLTAHHRDDVVETFLMRLSRGSGLGGLAGMRPCRCLPQGTLLVRPLLGVRRAELRHTLKAMGQPWIEDPSNRDDRFDRVRVRQWLQTQPDPDLFADRVAASARHLAAANEAIEWMVNRHMASHIREAHGGLAAADCRAFLDVPDEVLHRVVADCISRTGTARTTPRGEELDRLIALLRAGRSSTLGGCLIRIEGGELRFLPERPRC